MAQGNQKHPLFSLLGKSHSAAVPADPLECFLRSSEITFKVHIIFLFAEHKDVGLIQNLG